MRVCHPPKLLPDVLELPMPPLDEEPEEIPLLEDEPDEDEVRGVVTLDCPADTEEL
jgi:hypothetical protein